VLNHAFEALNRDLSAHLVLGELFALEEDVSKDLKLIGFHEGDRNGLLQLLAKRSNVNNLAGCCMMKRHRVSPADIFPVSPEQLASFSGSDQIISGARVQGIHRTDI
jgi:hypothetical protein